VERGCGGRRTVLRHSMAGKLIVLCLYHEGEQMTSETFNRFTGKTIKGREMTTPGRTAPSQPNRCLGFRHRLAFR
jgi:hypothetical protein